MLLDVTARGRVGRSVAALVNRGVVRECGRDYRSCGVNGLEGVAVGHGRVDDRAHQFGGVCRSWGPLDVGRKTVGERSCSGLCGPVKSAGSQNKGTVFDISFRAQI